MATRGLVGFYTEGITKGVYHHKDANPKALGSRLIEYLGETDYQWLDSRIRTWMEHAQPYPGEGEEILEWAELQQKLEDDNDDLTDGKNADYSQFLYRRIFCEYAYILNLDTQELEIYHSGCSQVEQAGRYVVLPEELQAKVNAIYDDFVESLVSRGIKKEEAEKTACRDGGVSHVMAISLMMIRGMSPKERQRFMMLLQWLIDTQNERNTMQLFLQESSILPAQVEKNSADETEHIQMKSESEFIMVSDPLGSNDAADLGSVETETYDDDESDENDQSDEDDEDDEDDESEANYRAMVKKSLKLTKAVNGMERALKGEERRRAIMDGIEFVQVSV